MEGGTKERLVKLRGNDCRCLACCPDIRTRPKTYYESTQSKESTTLPKLGDVAKM